MTPTERLAWLKESEIWFLRCMLIYKRTPAAAGRRPEWLDEAIPERPINHIVLMMGQAGRKNRDVALRVLFGCSFEDTEGNTADRNTRIINLCHGAIPAIPAETEQPRWSCYIQLERSLRTASWIIQTDDNHSESRPAA